MSRLLAAGLWLVVTVASTAVVWAATSIVAADVTDRPAAVLAQRDVVSELESGSSAAMTTGPKVPSSTSTVPAPRRGPTTTRAAGPSAGSRAPQPGATIAPGPPPTTATVPGAPPATRPANPPTTQATTRPGATYSTTGGIVRVACNGFLIDLVSAIPANGYAVNVVAGGPANVDVRFVRADREFPVKAVCFGQPIRYDGQVPFWPGPGPS